jgi:dTMP kinase
MEALERWVHPHLQPDLTLLFDVPLEVARERLDATARSTSSNQEQADFFANAAATNTCAARPVPARFVVIDSTRSDRARPRPICARRLESWL